MFRRGGRVLNCRGDEIARIEITVDGKTQGRSKRANAVIVSDNPYSKDSSLWLLVLCHFINDNELSIAS